MLTGQGSFEWQTWGSQLERNRLRLFRYGAEGSFGLRTIRSRGVGGGECAAIRPVILAQKESIAGGGEGACKAPFRNPGKHNWLERDRMGDGTSG